MLRFWKPLFALALVFFIGAMFGGLLTKVFFLHRDRPFWSRGGPGAANEMMVHRLTRALHLDPSQVQEVQEILAEAQMKNREAMTQIRPQMQQHRLEAQRKIEEILTPEQRDHFHQLINRDKAHLEEEKKHSAFGEFVPDLSAEQPGPAPQVTPLPIPSPAETGKTNAVPMVKP